MSFVVMDGFQCWKLILPICFLLQPATGMVTDILDALCFSEKTEVENIFTNSSSESSVLLTWDYVAYEYNESGATTAPNLYLNRHDYLSVSYSPCRYETWPALRHDPVTDVYLGRYDVDKSLYAERFTNLPGIKTNLFPPTRMRMDVPSLPFPGWPYVFCLNGMISGSLHQFGRVLGRTYAPRPKVCDGCFRTLWMLPQEQVRQVRVYWPHRIGQRVSFFLSVSEKASNDTTTLVDERGIRDDRGYVDVVISMRSHIFRFAASDPLVRKLSTDSIIVVPDENDLLELVPCISKTIESKRTAEIRALSWKMPKNVDVVQYYTLVWFDKKKWRENQDRSPVMDWIYIPRDRTSIKFRVVDSKEIDEERFGWRLIANTATSSSRLDFDG